MAEFNPYKLEEEKWTPKNVYEILPPNSVSWSDYDFGQGTDNVNEEAANKSLIDGVIDFFSELFGTAGQILGGAVELGGKILGGFVNGVANLIGGIAKAIGSIFGGGSGESPNLPLFNPIKTNLEAAIQPHRDKIDESWQRTEEVLAEQEALRGQMEINLEGMREASSRAQEATSRSDAAIAEAEAATTAAEEARETLESYNAALNKRITSEFNSAMAEIGRTNEALQANANTTADLIADLQTDFAADFDAISGRMKTITDTQGGLADGLSKAATQADYNKLNEILWGKQVDLNLNQQELNKRRRDWEEGASLALEKLSDGAIAQTKWNTGAETAIEALARVMGLNIGARNLLLRSMLNKTSSDYLIAELNFGDNPPLAGEEVTLSLKGQLGARSLYFAVYNSSGNGNARISALDLKPESRGGDGVYRSTGTWEEHGNNSKINIYASPSSATAASTIEWVKLERGNKSTDWSPAPEDIPTQAEVDELQNNAIRKNTTVGSENKSAIQALTDGLNAAIELGEANSAIEELSGTLAEEERKRRELQEEVDALQTEMIPRTIIHDDRVTYDEHIELSGNKVTAKGSWAGQLAVTYIERTGHGSSSTPYVYKTRVTRRTVPDGKTRSWTVGNEVERVDYWVYRGRQRTILLKNAGPYITGKTFSSGTWGVLATHKVGKTYGTGKIEWRADLQYADRGVTYRFKLEVNGTEIKNYYWSGVGPLTSLGSGKKTLRFEHEFTLPDDATVRILGYAANSNSQQARVSRLQGNLSYIQDTAREG